ncbi:High potential iron-sulfur protein [Luminiphilus syltensis NOR5-1B]|uniref:High potential iron-sulfur protein n=1 Tax=Luminiphilus syltensis NOR5-1B TaxID=565045 RepID=B8KTE5_9GAMM|nr:high-potential iron-sulfur protein [Luminiphilus syltensis]EED35709.1 High potential iron-sulfur protein [Luminiphilus syltensis NOR5-1B]
MKNVNRRKFLQSSAVAGAGLLIARFSHAQEVVSEDEGIAVAMGYKADHTAVDTAKWSKKAGADGAQQQCTSCSLYEEIDDEFGLCPLFAGKRVHASGWCNGWVA